ncbi:hypothetical protein [Megalodesulfovibrio paquesii]
MRGLRLLTLALLLTGACSAAGFAENATTAPTIMVLSVEDQVRLKLLEEKVEELKKGLAEVEGKVAGLGRETVATKTQIEYAEKYVDFKATLLNLWLAGVAIVFTVVTLIVIPNKLRETQLLYNNSKAKAQKLLEHLHSINEEAQQTLLQYTEAAKSKVLQLDAIAELTPEDAKDLALVANQNKDLYAKHVAQAIQAQAREDWNTAREAWGKALEIEPKSQRALLGLGVCYTYLADLSRHLPQRMELLKTAKEQYERAISINKRFHEAFYNLGVVLSKIADETPTADEKERYNLLQQALESLLEAFNIKPNDPETNLSIGIILSKKAHILLPSNPEEGRKLISNAIMHYDVSSRSEEWKSKAYFNWGNALAELAQTYMSQGNLHRAKEYFKEAQFKYQRAYAKNQQDHLAAGNYGSTLLSLASPQLAEDEPSRIQLLEEAKRWFMLSLNLEPKGSRYPLACAEAQLGNHDEAKRLLEIELDNSLLALKQSPCSHLATDPDLQPLRDHDPAWWADFMRRACPEASPPQSESETSPSS